MATKKFVGIELSTESLKIAELDSSGSANFKVAYLKEIPIPMLTLPGGERTQDSVVDWEILISTLKEELKDKNYVSASISLVIPSKDANTTLLTIPLVKRRDIIQFLERELRKTITIQEDVETHIGYLRLGERVTKSGKMQDVLTIFTDRAKLIDYFNNFVSAGIKPNIFTVNTFSLYSLIVNFYPELDNAVLVNIGQSLTSIVIIRARQLKFVRSMYITLGNLVESISQKLLIPVKETEEFVGKYGFDFESYPKTEQAQRYKNSISKFLDKFKAELQRSILFYQEKFGTGEKISQIILTGMALDIKGLQEIFKDKFKLNVELLPVSKKINFPSDMENAESVYRLYASCIGAALIHELKYKVNLLPRTEKRKVAKSIYIEVCTILLVIYGVTYYNYFEYNKSLSARKNQFKQIQLAIQEYPADLNKEYENVLKKREEFSQLEKNFSDFQKPYVNWEKLFLEMGNLTAPEMLIDSVWVSFNKEGKMVFQIDGEYTGTFPDTQLTLRKVRLGLEESSFFKDVKFEIKRSGKVNIGEVKKFPYTIAGYIDEKVQEKRKL